MNQEFKEACGIFGIVGHPDAARLTYLGMYALQHRGQESAGIVVSDGKHLNGYRGLGLVSDVFNEDVLANLKGDCAIGHVRYSTTGKTLLKNAQPFMVEYSRGPIAVGHNGNLINVSQLRQKLQEEGSIFQSTVDSEVIIHLLAKGTGSFESSLVDALAQIKGSYSLVFLTPTQLIAARDPFGNRPLSIGKFNGGYVVASETCAFDLIRAEHIRDVEPGEIVFIDKSGIKSIQPYPKAKRGFCIFEMIYFARPDSNVFGGNVYLTRKNLGRNLAIESPSKADMVLPIPDSGNSAAVGYAQELNLPFDIGIVRNHYIGRTFIQPSQTIRDFGVRVKLNPVKDLIRGKTLAIVEDSIVRGTTSRSRIRTLREAGAKEIHMKISCPPIKHPCYFGIDFPTNDELIAGSKTVNEIKDFVELDSLFYLSLDGMLKSMPLSPENYCTGCFTGCYPVPACEDMNKFKLEKLIFVDY